MENSTKILLMFTCFIFSNGLQAMSEEEKIYENLLRINIISRLQYRYQLLSITELGKKAQDIIDYADDYIGNVNQHYELLKAAYELKTNVESISKDSWETEDVWNNIGNAMELLLPEKSIEMKNLVEKYWEKINPETKKDLTLFKNQIKEKKEYSDEIDKKIKKLAQNVFNGFVDAFIEIVSEDKLLNNLATSLKMLL